MLAWALGQLGGAVLLLWQAGLPDPLVLLLLLPFALAALSRRHLRWLCAAWLGAALAAWQVDAVLDERLDPAFDGQVFTVTGRIEDLPEQRGRYLRFPFLVESGELDGEPVSLPRRVRLNLYDNLDIAAGERWQWRVKLRRPRGFANPGTFDYERWLLTERFGATGYVREPYRARRLETASGEWRAAIAARVAEIADGPAAGLVRALAVADRGGISDAQWEIFRATGTAHLMAISGLHVGLVAGLGLAVAGFMRRFWFPRASLAWAPLLAGALALVYGMLAGFGLPVQRALVAAGVVLGALALRRSVMPGHAFGLALTTVLCFDPLAPLDLGFWLSFGAVGAIIYLLAGRRPSGSSWRRALRVQFGLAVLLAPLTLLGFGQVPLASPLANAVAIPLFGLAIVPVVLIALALLPWPPAAAALFTVANWLLDALLAFLGWLATVLPAVTLPKPSPLAWVATVLGLLLLLAPRALPGRALAIVLLIPFAWTLLAPRADAPPLAIHFLDVGQGSAVVIETPRHTLVYDAGPRFGDTDAAELVIAPFLEARGREPELIMISHSDSDHAGGLATLAERFPGARAAGRTPGAETDCAGMSWTWEEVVFDVLHPLASAHGEDNEQSCVLRVAWREHVVLLTGDIEAGGEARLLREEPALLRSEVALVPHHGSLTSSSAAFVAAVRPDLAVATAGFGNRWRFPRDTVVARWREQGARVLVTGEYGAISVRFDDSGMQIGSFREARRLWREPPPDADDRGFP